jgi:hypothetical protein
MNLIETNEHKRRMDTLGRNLAVAGALCEAYDAGRSFTHANLLAWHPNLHGDAWRP